MKLADAVTIEDLRSQAQRRLPSHVFDIIEGGAGDEVTLGRNRAGFAAYAFRPRPFVDVSVRDLSTTVLNDSISLPVMLAPTGASRVVHRMAELAVARAARAAGTIYMQSTVTSFELEAVASTGPGPLWYQLYLPPTRDGLIDIVNRVAAAGYTALSLTIDTPIYGNRDRDAHNKLTIPAKITPKMVLNGAVRPSWALDFLRGNVISVGKRGQRRLSPTATQEQIVATQWPVTWDDLKQVRDAWGGPLIVKGIMRSNECDELATIGVDAVVVSNHGGRQLDCLPGSIDVLAEVVQACRGRMQVYLDGGVRRGVDVVAAIALGAKAVFVGRPYLYGLAVGGEAGVSKALNILHSEIDRTMALVGCPRIQDIDSSILIRHSRQV